MIHCGDTYLAGPEDEALHLHVVLTEPDENGEIVVVSITTARARSERLVVLNAGDHPFLRHPSVVAYRYSEVVFVADLERALREGSARRNGPISEVLLHRLRAGLIESDFTPNGVRAFYLERQPETPLD